MSSTKIDPLVPANRVWVYIDYSFACLEFYQWEYSNPA